MSRVPDLDKLFSPKSIVLIGSSTIKIDQNMISPTIFNAIRENLKEFKGRVKVIDVKDGNVKVNLEKEYDVAVIVLPPKETVSSLRQIGEKIHFAIIIPGGFSDEDKVKLNELSKKYGFRILGPNSIMGVISSSIRLNTSFEPDFIPKVGSISIVCQSGGVGASLLDSLIEEGLGLDLSIWIGDSLDIDVIEVLKYLGKRDQTKTIGIYLEGVKDGRAFLSAIAEIVPNKPIVILKGGAAEASAERALLHTASIAGSHRIFTVAVRQAGAIVVEAIDEFITALKALGLKNKSMKGRSIAIVSNVGGPAILAADACFLYGFSTPPLSDEVYERIKKVFPLIEPVNPIDLIADADHNRYIMVLREVMKEEHIDGILLITMFRSCLTTPEDVKKIIEMVSFKKPCVIYTGGYGDLRKLMSVLPPEYHHKVVVVDDVWKAAFAFDVLYDYSVTCVEAAKRYMSSVVE